MLSFLSQLRKIFAFLVLKDDVSIWYNVSLSVISCIWFKQYSFDIKHVNTMNSDYFFT